MKACRPGLNLILALTFLLTVNWNTAGQEVGVSPQRRPNIVWIIVEDMSADFSCYGVQLIQTPHVDRLAREGTRFANAFTTAPVCSTSRSALITGMHQTAIGAHHHRSGRGELKIRLPEGVEPIPSLLQKAGYYTCIGSGTESLVAPRQAAALGKTDYNFEWNQAIYDSDDWAGRKPDQPFFMQVQLSGGKLRGENEKQTATFIEQVKQELGTSTSFEKVELPPYYPRDEVLLRDWAAYLDAVRITDEQVGKVVARLEKEGLLDNTLILFMTDHGISHARGKQFLYDEGTRVPLIACGPGVPRGKVRDDLVEHIDLAAVTLAAAGVVIPPKMQARDLFDPHYAPRNAVFAARDRCDETVDRIRSIRTERYLYIQNDYSGRPYLQPNAYKDSKQIVRRLRELHAAGQLDELSEGLLFRTERPSEELYDWRDDRWQIRNLAGTPELEPLRQELRASLETWRRANDAYGPESEAMYDSDMRAYVGRSNPQVEANVALMKQWAREGK